MLSIIICSISPECLQAISKNIQETIGTEYEIIAIDNREQNWPIAKAYNYGAQQAIYPYLFFVHEDVQFHSKDWGKYIEQKLAETDCGVIGFAGSKVKLKTYSGWVQNTDWDTVHFYQRMINGISSFNVTGAFLQHPFEHILVIDGFAMFVRRCVWEENAFDEKNLTGFHCYDLDFSMQIAKKYKNYICCSFILIEHFSNGCYNAKWVSETIRMHEAKWRHFLPMMVPGLELSEKIIKKSNERVLNSFLFLALRTNTSDADRRKLLLKFLGMPFSWKHLSHCFSCTLKYVRTLLAS